jgi:hypothetical protein
MKRYVKICPCKREHPSGARGFCPQCNVRLADIEACEIDDARAVQTPDPGLVRCAACGGMTRPMMLCEICDKELREAAVPESASRPAAIVDTKLEMVMGTQTFECRNGDILGKEGTLASQIFQGIGTVSRRHVLVTQEDGKWSLTVFAGVQNATQLDGQELRRAVPYALTGDHQLKLSYACEVSLRVSPL